MLAAKDGHCLDPLTHEELQNSDALTLSFLLTVTGMLSHGGSVFLTGLVTLRIGKIKIIVSYPLLTNV